MAHSSFNSGNLLNLRTWPGHFLEVLQHRLHGNEGPAFLLIQDRFGGLFPQPL